EFTGMWARVFQHEYDHLNLKFFVDRLNGVKRQLLKPKLARVRRGEFKTQYPSVSAKEEQ
ncbi:MAG: peptide deformylase, partial [Candidatus Kryptoniota bacterium]